MNTPTAEEFREARPLRNAVAARLAAATIDGQRIVTGVEAGVLADHLLTMGVVEATWSGPVKAPTRVHTLRISVDEPVTT